MKKTMLAITALSTLLAVPAAVEAKDKLTPQQELDKLLEGRVPGKPVSCISLSDTRDSQVFDKTAIVYNTGSVIYVNKTTHPESLDSDYILVVKITGSQLCNLDTIQLHDRSSQMWSGFVGLTDFIPYRRAPKAN